MPPYSCMDGGTGGNFWGLNRPVLLYFAKLARTPYMTGEGPVAETATSFWPTGARYGVVTVRATINDNDRTTTGQNITAAEAYIGVPPWRPGAVAIPLAAQDGNFDSPVEVVTGTFPSGVARRLIYIRGRDAQGNWGPFTAVWVPAVNS